MDKQMIEEMAKVKIGAILEKVNMGDGYADIDSLADEIYHIAIPENAVVLTREEYEKLDIVKEMYGSSDKVKPSDILRMLAMTDKVARKETTEKFARKSKQRLHDKLHRGKALHTTVLGKEYVRRIFKEAIDEIYKEIIGEEK